MHPKTIQNKQYQASWEHVSGHSGNPWNELADAICFAIQARPVEMADLTKPDGIDLEVNYNFPENGLGDLSLRIDASHFLSYEIPMGGQTTDVVGFFNHDNFARSLPDTKANASLKWESGKHQASVTARNIAGYKTTRAAPPAGYSQNIDSLLTWDAQYNYELDMASMATQITLGVLNLTDEEPPLVWDAANFSYDSRQHDARGRMAYVRLKFAF